MSVTRQVRAFVLFVLLGLLPVALGACSAQIDVRGSAPSDEDLVTVRPGLDTKTDIHERFGLPITVSAADPNIWYYVKQDLRPLPLSPPEVIDQRIVVVAHVRALVRGHAARDPPQPEQAEHVVDADAARVPQHGAQHVAVGQEPDLRQCIGPPRRL